MKKINRAWIYVLSALFAAGCASPGIELQSTTSPLQSGDKSGAGVSQPAPQVEVLPGSPAGTSQVPMPVIVVTPETGDFSQPLEAVMTPSTAEQNELVRQAIEDLAHRLDVSPEDISLLDITSVVWSDGSMGCPQPGMFYTQALVEGARIRLQVSDTVYHYHSGRGQAPFFCENPSEEAGNPSFTVTE